MMVIRKLIIMILLVHVIHIGNLLNSTWAESYSQHKLDANRVPWTHLSYHAKNFWVDVKTKVLMESMPADAVKAALIKNLQGDALQVPCTGSYKITANTVLDSIFQPPVKIDNQVWFDPKDATAFGRIRLRKGEDDFKKVYRFTKQGVFRHRREPKNEQEIKLETDKWTNVVDTFYPYNLDQLGCPNVSERLLLVYIASAAEITENNTPFDFCNFGKRQLFRVRLQPEGFHSVKTNFFLKQNKVEHIKKGETKALKLKLETRPLDSNLKKVENFSFLGFHKNIAFFIDPVTNLPIQISGEIPTVGKATLKLNEVNLR